MPKKRKIDQYSDPDSDPNEEDEEELDENELRKVLEGFAKEQIVDLLLKAASTNPKLVEDVYELADTDPSQRKLFVHGLGWETTSETLREFYSQYGEIEECNVVADKITGKSKGYGFLSFKHRRSAQKALKEPQKRIESRITACQLASAGPINTNLQPHQHQSSTPSQEVLARKIYVGNVNSDISSDRLFAFFSKYGEIDEGPLGFDKQTKKSKGFALFIYRTAEGARKALEEPSKNFDGHLLYCQKATDSHKQKAVAQTMPVGMPSGGGGGYNIPGVMAYNPHNGMAPQGFVGNPAMFGQGVAPIHAALTVLAAAGQHPAAFGAPPAGMMPFDPSMFGGYGLAPTYQAPHVPGNQRPGARPSGGR